MDEYRFGLLTLEEIEAREIDTPPVTPTGHLLAVALVCLVSAGLVMALWSILLGFALAILAACVIARAAWGEE